jgi:hypothetical protein
MRLYCASERRRSARSWPMKPAAPVIKILTIFGKKVIIIRYSRRCMREKN